MNRLGVALVVFLVGGCATPGADPTLEASATDVLTDAGLSSADSGTGLTESQAIEIAHTAAPQNVGRVIKVAESGPLSEVWEDSLIHEWAHDLSPDAPVWYLYFADDEQSRGSIVVIDYFDGTVLYTSEAETFVVGP